jgi:hypothetical protein
VDVAHRLDDATVYAGVHFLIAMFTSHWVEPIAKSIELFRQSVEYGLQYGDHVHAAYSAARSFSHEQFRGTELRSLYEDGKATCALLESIGDMTNLEFLEPRLRYIDWLSGNRPQSNTLGSETMSEEAVTAAKRERGNKSFESDWIMLLERQRYLAGELEQALEFGHEAEQLVPFSSGFVTQVEHSFYYALIAARLHDSSDTARAHELEALVESQVEKLPQRAVSAPSNYNLM